MHLLSCEHPIRVYNLYSKEYVHVPCGKCPTCRKNRASRWISRLEEERKQHLFCMFVTLTYSDEFLPYYRSVSGCMDKLIATRNVRNKFSRTVNSDGYVVKGKASFKRVPDFSRYINVSELEFDSSADIDYFQQRVLIDGIPFADVQDIQNFNKRLNKYFRNEVTKKYSNFRYFCVSEYGSTTIRPHFHCLYFVDDSSVSSRFSEAVASCWPFGRIDSQIVGGSACSYVSQYLNKLFSLPSFYQDRRLRPFFVCSKRPPIGGFNEFSHDFKEIFDKTITHRAVRDAKDPTKLRIVPQLKCVENRLFPKIPFYSQLSLSLRAELYRCACRSLYHLGMSSFKNWLSCLKGYLYARPDRHSPNAFVVYLSTIANNFTERGVNALKRLYYISKRVMQYAHDFGITVHDYVVQIDKYWSKKELQALNEFYRFQEEYSRDGMHTEELVYMYPDFCFQNNISSSSYCVSLDDCSDFKMMSKDSALWNKEETKTHFKNSYFEEKLAKGDKMFNLLKKYYYAKKCNEAT